MPNPRPEAVSAARPPLSKRAITLIAATSARPRSAADTAYGLDHLMTEVEKGREAAFVWINRARRDTRS